MNARSTYRLTVPLMGEGQVDALIADLYKVPGDEIAVDEPIYQMETDKAQVEIESPVAGRLVQWHTTVGQRLDMGSLIAEIELADGDGDASGEPASPRAVPAGDDGAAEAQVRDTADRRPGPIVPPRTREYARTIGLDAGELARVPSRSRFLTPADVDAYVDRAGVGGSEYTEESASRRQVALNAAMRKGAETCVGASVSMVFDASLLVRAKHAKANRLDGLVTDVQVFAYHAAQTVAAHPLLRSTIGGDDTIRTYSDVNIGISVAADSGDLYVAGIDNVANLSFDDFHARFARAVDAAREGRSSIGAGTTILFSHLGSDVDDALPVVVPPASATLFLGGTRRHSPDRRMVLAFDHCLMNGQQAADYLAGVVAELQRAADPDPDPESRDDWPPSSGPVDSDSDRFVRAVAGAAAQVLGHPVDLGGRISDVGIDSASAAAIIAEVNSRLGTAFSPGVMYRHASLLDAALALGGQGAERDRPLPTQPTAKADFDDPVAIIGVGCRFAGNITNAAGLWRVALERRDVTGPVPRDRGWDVDGLYDPDLDASGSFYARGGGFLSGISAFDRGFFAISPREAQAMDPQQRILLEVAWEAFENAGIVPESLRGSDTGVYVGSMSSGYERTLPAEFGGYLLTGSASSVASGRISYCYDFGGPAMTVDTACSSSLTALHLARRAVSAGECSLALVGGVTVMSSPELLLEFSRLRALSPDGRCKAFAEGADGFALGEGAGVVLLEKLSDARRKGHPVLAVIRGSAVNQDGASNGLTAPNGAAQERVIRAALADAGLSGAEVDLVEAHGTGTAIGDAVEAHALMNTYGEAHRGIEPLRLGSVKSNIGHAQAAAGLAGVIKVVEAIRHRIMPPTLHADLSTRHIDWSDSGMRVLTEPLDWARAKSPRRAGVSGFGISGTNVHVIVEEPA